MRSPKTKSQVLATTESAREQLESTRRYPLSYSPGSSTVVNISRLPDPNGLRGMELSFREETRCEEDLSKVARQQIAIFAVVGSLSAFLVHFVGPVIPFAYAFIASLVTATGAAVAFIFFPSKRNIRRILMSFFLPPAAVVGSYFLSIALSARPVASLILGLLSITLILWTRAKNHPVSFYREWIFSAPHLKPETRRRRPHLPGGHAITPATDRIVMIIRYAFHVGASLAILAVVVVVGAYSPTVAICCLFFAALALTDFWPPRIYRLAIHSLSHYLTYGERLSGAAGVWIPEATLKERRCAIALTVFLFYLFLSTGLCLYFPSDIITIEKRIELEDDRREKAAREKTKPEDGKKGKDETFYVRRNPEVVRQVIRDYYSPESALAPYRKSGDGYLSTLLRFVSARNSAAHEGITIFHSSLWRTWQVSTANIFLFFVIPFVVALILPNLLILGLCRGFLIEGEELRQKVEGFDKSAIERAFMKAGRVFRNLCRRLKGLPPLEPPQGFVFGVDDDERTEWQWYVDRISQSSHVAKDDTGRPVREASHLFLGVEPSQKFPVLLDRKIINEHCHIVGQTGSGKTSLGLMPLLIQLLRGHALPTSKKNGTQKERSEPVTMIIIDLKGDSALFNTARAEAEARSQAFRFFTPEKGKVTHFFNPFLGFASESRTFIQLVQLFLDSLSLNHGEGYGRSYYTRRNRQAIFEALNHPSKPRDFQALKEVMAEMIQRAEYKDAYEAFTTVFALAEYKNLITTNEQEQNAPESTINMARAIEENQVVYFWLPSAIESVTTREIGKLALFSVLSSAIDRKLTRPDVQPRQVYLMIDEFQRIAGANLSIILQQARSFGISAILANQAISDLKLPGEDLRPVVRANTRVQLHFTVGEPDEMSSLSKLSGEEVRVTKAWGTTENLMKLLIRRSTKTETWTEGVKSRLTVNDIAGIGDHPLEFIANISRGSGYTQFAGLPFRVRTTWPISEELYNERQNTPWPTKDEFPIGEVVENLRSPKEIEEDSRTELFKKQQEILKRAIEEKVC